MRRAGTSKATQEAARAELIYSAIPINGTLAERYLRKRHIDTSALSSWALRPLGYVESCYHETGRHFPALVATVCDHADKTIAAHRIYLSKTAEKASITPNKSSLASTKGGVIRLSPTRRKIILTEGLEDGLSIALSIGNDFECGVWCGVGGNLSSIIIPKKVVRHVVLAVDNDPAGRGYIQELAPRLKRQGFFVSVALPTHGCKDFNELLCDHGILFNPNMIEAYHE